MYCPACRKGKRGPGAVKIETASAPQSGKVPMTGHTQYGHTWQTSHLQWPALFLQSFFEIYSIYMQMYAWECGGTHGYACTQKPEEGSDPSELYVQALMGHLARCLGAEIWTLFLMVVFQALFLMSLRCSSRNVHLSHKSSTCLCLSATYIAMSQKGELSHGPITRDRP